MIMKKYKRCKTYTDDVYRNRPIVHFLLINKLFRQMIKIYSVEIIHYILEDINSVKISAI